MDQVNLLFEVVGALLSWYNVRTSWDTPPQGVSVSVIAFSALWAVECIPYYLGHDEVFTAVAAGARCAGHLVWSWRALGWRVAT